MGHFHSGIMYYSALWVCPNAAFKTVSNGVVASFKGFERSDVVASTTIIRREKWRCRT
jgi:hypothetical protein